MRQLKITKQVTNRESKSLEKYLQDVSKLPLITADEEVELAQQIREGDQKALDKLVNANLRFVISVAKQYQNQGLKLSDLINEGNIGLVKAAKRFDETRGFKFISYAVWWIRQSILKSLAEQSRVVRLPLNRINTISKVKKAISSLEQKHQRHPSNQELATELDLPIDNIEESVRNASKNLSMDAPLKEGETSNLYSLVAHKESTNPDKNLLLESLQSDVDKALDRLTEKEANIIRLYYGIGSFDSISLFEIGEIFDLTRERVRQIKDRAINRLRRSSDTRILRTYLG
ncbi:RNA polymerase sigma factor RpoD/SigA [Aquimarina sp. SS2-1]|uniref:sigma-70 family RNA polymerase sigma factor n=1 Tax=Aquimarina besae TaxID=3342247 RepID=UPI00366CB15A